MSNAQSLTLRLQSALTGPFIPQRCQELTDVLNDLSAKDASHVYRIIVESIFEVSRDDVTQTVHYAGGWGLRVITAAEHCNEFNALRTFLSAKGPLLSLGFRLTNDPFVLYPYPVSYLPPKVRSEIEDGSASSYYSQKIQNLGPGKLPINIMLNAFEFYVYHFSHFLLGNWMASGGGGYWASIAECLYPTLVEDLLMTFMPLDASLPPGPSGMPVAPRGVLSHMPQRVSGTTISGPNLNLSNLMSPILRPSRPVDGVANIIDTSIGGRHGGAYTSSPVPGNAGNYMHSQAEFSTWSSQAVLQILLEQWVNQCTYAPAKVHLHATHNSTQEIFVPSCDHVYIVRILVKHLHYFCNSIKPQQQLPLDQLRRSVWGMSRKVIYKFMKHLFLHWPLDSSFKLVLETWLSFIQPWRYTVYVPRNKILSQSMEEVNRILDRKWINFMGENLLLYTYLFELLLSRLLRLDLASPKNAHILFRVSKVYNQDKFVELIEEIEDTIGQNVQRSFLGDFLGTPNRNAMPESPHRSNHMDLTISAHSIAQSARNHILEVEGQRHRYESLFSVNTIDKVQCLLKSIKKAEEAISQEITANTAKKFSEGSSGVLGYVINTLTATPQSSEEKQRLEDMQKSLTYLNLSSNHLCTIFKTSPPLSASSLDLSTLQPNFPHVPGEKIGIPDQILTTNGPVLSPFGQMQMMNGLRRYDIKYDGDPDLKPICSYEVNFLVRILYALSLAINKKYELSMTRYYYRKDFIGKLSRVFLRPAEIVYYYDKTEEGNRKKRPKTLSPRISLRPLASKPLIGFILAFWLILSVMGVSIIRICTHMMIPFVVVYILGKALLEDSSTLDLSLHVRDNNNQTQN